MGEVDELRGEVERLTTLLDSRNRVVEKVKRLAQNWQARALAAEAEAEHELMPYPTSNGPLAPENDRMAAHMGGFTDAADTTGPYAVGNDQQGETT